MSIATQITFGFATVACAIILFPTLVFAQGSVEFVPLAPIPGLTDTVETDNLATFFNALYKFAIGIAVVLAVLQLIRAGLMYMGGDSVTEIGKAREIIRETILGLLLVLAPALVFGIINPDILNLKLDTKSLRVEQVSTGGGNNASGGGGQMGGSQSATPEQGCAGQLNGTYLKTVVCAAQSDATNFSCGADLEHKVAEFCPSGRKNAENQCIGGATWKVSCEKSATVLYYRYLRGYGPFSVLGIVEQVIPRDESTQTAFQNGCRNDDGSFGHETTRAGQAFIASNAWRITNGCPSDAGIMRDENIGTGVACYSEKLTCKP